MGDQQRDWYTKIAKETIVQLPYQLAGGLSNVPPRRAGGVHNADGHAVEQPELFIKNTLARIIRLQQVTNDPRLLGIEVPSAKYEWLEDWLRDNPNTPAVVLSQFRDTAIRLAKQFSGACVVGGSDLGAAADFINGGTRLLVGTIAAAGESLNLQRADVLIFVEQVWSATKMQQAVDRVHRINITSPKLIINLQCDHSIDLLVSLALKHKLTDAQVVYELLHNQGDYT